MHGLDEEQQQALADRVGAMLSWEALAAHARAADLVDANQNLLWESRILTDIRPVFTEGNEPKATHGLVLHSLQLTYWNGAQLTELFVTLDRDELQRLAKVIERAQKKEIQAEELMKKADLPRVGTDVGVDDEGA
ncbi:hypothetical protein DVS28_a0587 [Euzebya pacifica]|uniref:Uncharacterized protein n=2 Tax=Euzebya pacifica TaxID=1608957 RepID=A0A346XSU4_9ACTN|nr:hypothetical protein DVS28_a0587 [Euzebya pacifica]